MGRAGLAGTLPCCASTGSDTASVRAAEDTADALHALWLLRRGEGPTAVAAVVGVSRNSVQQWLRWYRAGGLAEVRSHRWGSPGKPSFLTPAQQAQLVEGVFATAQAVRDWIEEQFGVAYTVGSLYTLLPRLGIRLKTPRPRHEKTDAQAQATWKKGGSGNA